MRFFKMLAMIGIGAGILGAGAARGDEAENYRKMMDQQRKMMEKSILSRPEYKPGATVRMEEIIGLSMTDGHLVIKCPLIEGGAVKTNKGQMRVKVEGLEGWSTIIAQVIGRGAMQWYVSFNHMSYPDLEGQQNLVVSVQPGLLQVAKNYNSMHKNFNVNLQQINGRPEFGQEDGVTLSVYQGDNQGRAPVSVTVSEKDFATLRRKHPKEVDQYLRPLLKELQLEGLFAVEHAVAWQVFSAEWKRDAALAERVKGLVPGLDSDKYAEREKSMDGLRKLGAEGALTLYHMGREGLSLEARVRVDAVIAGHSFLSKDQAGRMGRDVDFLLDCLYSEEVEVRTVAGTYLTKLAGKEIDFDASAAREARVGKIEALRKLLTVKPKAATKPTTRAATQAAIIIKTEGEAKQFPRLSDKVKR